MPPPFLAVYPCPSPLRGEGWGEGLKLALPTDALENVLSDD